MLRINSLSLQHQGKIIHNLNLLLKHGERITLILNTMEEIDILIKLFQGRILYQGNYEFEGQEVIDFSPSRGAAYRRKEAVYLEFDIPYQNELTLEKLIMSSLKYSGIYPSKWKAIINNTSSLLGLSEKKKSKLCDLSEIERLRAYLAKAVAIEPKLVVMKDPDLYFWGLNGNYLKSLLDEIRLFNNTAFCVFALKDDSVKAVDRSYNLRDGYVTSV